MGPGRWHLFEHTADIGLEVTAAGLTDLFETAAAALFAQLTDPESIEPRERRCIEVHGVDREELLVRWLGELLSLHDAEGILFRRFKVTRLEPESLVGLAEGEMFDPTRHAMRSEIKAVTYHQIRILERDGTWTARLVLDV